MLQEKKRAWALPDVSVWFSPGFPLGPAGTWMIPHVRDRDKSSTFFSKTRGSTSLCPYPRHTWKHQTDIFDTLIMNQICCARQEIVPVSQVWLNQIFLALTSNGENKYVLTERKSSEAQVPCTYPFGRHRARLEPGTRGTWTQRWDSAPRGQAQDKPDGVTLSNFPWPQGVLLVESLRFLCKTGCELRGG